ncbi:MAG: hypothetical protein FJ318_08665 [SAR202 cluster bacterium]|nr:hypothetical protein [SAR202 cluster bacterium]
MTTRPKRMSEESVCKTTGKTRTDWFALLDAAGARGWLHKRTAQWLHDQGLIDSGWWRQSVTVEYEKARGLRVHGESSAGGFQLGATRTLNVTPDAAWAFLVSRQGLRAWLGDTKALPLEKGRRYVTADLTEGEVRPVEPGRKLRLTRRPAVRSSPSRSNCT